MSDYPVGAGRFFVCVGGGDGAGWMMLVVGWLVVLLVVGRCVVGRHGYCILWGKKRLCYVSYSRIKFIRSRCR